MLNYAEISENMKNCLVLGSSPIAISFSAAFPENIQQLDGKIRLCQMLDKVRLNGEIFYTTALNHQCDGGSSSCGMKEMNENIKSGEFLHKMGLFGSSRAARRFINSNPRIEPGTVNVLIFSPLEKTAFEPDVVAVICNAKQGMIIAEAFAYETGGRAHGLTGPPICSSIVAAPFLTGEVTYSFGDHGARKYMDIKDEEVFVGIPGELLEAVIENLGKLAI